MDYVCPRDMVANKIDKVPVLQAFIIEEETDNEVHTHKWVIYL